MSIPGTHRFMKRLGLPVVVAVVAVAGVGCGDESSYVYVEPASVEAVGDDLWKVSLTERAAERTGIETVEVAMQSIDGVDRLVVPYSSIMYHFDGATFTYTNPEPLLFIRAPITIDSIDGDVAVRDDGPEVGTAVVTVGAAQLYGVEFGIGK